MSDTQEKLDSWALVELFGHQRIVGKVTEASLAGGAFLRVDVPADQEHKAFTRFYSPGAIYAISPVTEEIALGMIRQYRHEPVSRFDFPQIAEKAPTFQPGPSSENLDDGNFHDREDED